MTSWIGWFTFFFSLEARIDRTSLSFIDPNSTNAKIETVNLYRFANFYTTNWIHPCSSVIIDFERIDFLWERRKCWRLWSREKFHPVAIDTVSRRRNAELSKRKERKKILFDSNRPLIDGNKYIFLCSIEEGEGRSWKTPVHRRVEHTVETQGMLVEIDFLCKWDRIVPGIINQVKTRLPGRWPTLAPAQLFVTKRLSPANPWYCCF